ncbi:MAG: hypothetical protein V3V16_14930 [Melioribacteraceae bacterium]
MKPLICVSSEGNDTKIVILSKEGKNIIVKKAFSLVMSGGDTFSNSIEDQAELKQLQNANSEFDFESVGQGGELKSIDKNDINHVTSYFSESDLKNGTFIPVVSEPVVNHHVYIGGKEKNRQKTLDAIIKDISEQKNITVAGDSIDFFEIDENKIHSVFLNEDNTSVNFINAWATFNGKKHYKIKTVKNSETALAHYVTKTSEFFDEDYSLIIYTGHESSRLIFLKGNELIHIGSPLDVGVKNIHTYDVYFSKILLEMENGNIPRLDNVVLCGDDNSENLVLSFYGTFPEANVTELKFEGIDFSNLEDEQKENLSAFAFPLVAGLEFFEEQNKEYDGINFMPKYIVENQKTFQFSWHSLVVLPFLFIAAFFFTYKILDNAQEIKAKTQEVNRLIELKAQNELIVAEMNDYTTKINGFDKTQAVLDKATDGAEVWGTMLINISDFIERRRNFWISNLENSGSEVKITGYSLSRNVLTEFVDNNNSSLLNTVIHEPLREAKTFAYTLNFKLNKQEEAK